MVEDPPHNLQVSGHGHHGLGGPIGLKPVGRVTGGLALLGWGVHPSFSPESHTRIRSRFMEYTFWGFSRTVESKLSQRPESYGRDDDVFVG